MKKIIYLIALILSVQIVNALYGGDTWSYHFPLCNQLVVNITGELPIDDNEYLILNDCTGENNNYICDCSDSYYFNVSFKTNTINNYTFLFNYDYFKEVKTVSTGTSSGGYISSWICGNWSECLNNRTERICRKSKTVNYTQYKSCLSPPLIPKEPVKGKIVEREVEEEINLIEKIDTKEDIVCTDCGGGAVYDTARKDFIKRMISVIVILTVVIIGLAGYFVYKKKKRLKEKD